MLVFGTCCFLRDCFLFIFTVYFAIFSKILHEILSFCIKTFKNYNLNKKFALRSAKSFYKKRSRSTMNTYIYLDFPISTQCFKVFKTIALLVLRLTAVAIPLIGVIPFLLGLYFQLLVISPHRFFRR
jgi:hypothetical protein